MQNMINKMRKSATSRKTLALTVILLMLGSMIAPFAMAAEITTAKLYYYYPEDQSVDIVGVDFLPETQITITIDILEAGTHFEDVITSDINGGFTYTYPLDGTLFTYIVEANDGTNTATTTFYYPTTVNVNFATSGLPASTSVTVSYSGTNPGGGSQIGSTTFSSPGPSGNIGFKELTPVTFSFPSITGYTLSSTSVSSPYTLPSSGSPTPSVTITGYYTPASSNHNPVVNVGSSTGTVNEGSTFTRSGSFTDADAGDAWHATVNYDDGNGAVALTLNTDKTFDLSVTYPDGPATKTITVTVYDDHGGSGTGTITITVNNVAPDITSMPCPDPIKIDTSFTVSAAYTDPGTLDTQTATWNWGDGSTPSVGTVVYTTGSGGSGTVSGTHTYTDTGLYIVSLTVTDKDGGSDTETSECYFVVYDPSAGFATGGGWINSPEGAYPEEPLLTGKATFGFVSKYQKGATVPVGNTEFQFHAGDLKFKSTSYDWLVVTGGNKAMFKGTGAVNGVDGYQFILTAIDGQKGSPDQFRIKITLGETVIYDNKMGSLDNSFDAMNIESGSIVVHK